MAYSPPSGGAAAAAKDRRATSSCRRGRGGQSISEMSHATELQIQNIEGVLETIHG